MNNAVSAFVCDIGAAAGKLSVREHIRGVYDGANVMREFAAKEAERLGSPDVAAAIRGLALPVAAPPSN